ncbi:MAG: hypothetical protein R2726_15370 [Acidimicrobiales bacterium]
MLPYADERSRPAERTWKRPVLVGSVCMALGVLVLAGWARSRATDESSSLANPPSATAAPVDQCAPPEPKPATVSSSDIAEAEAAKRRAADEFASTGGWARIKAPDFRTGVWVCGWYKGIDSSPAGDIREKLYDRPAGQLRGFVYPAVGFVDVEVAVQPSFNAKDERIRLNGCDPMTDRTCRPVR